jgi:hypothetical protein
MIRQSGEREARKKRVQVAAQPGSEQAEARSDDIRVDDIDPADFFDPEEFGFCRRSFNDHRP